jgi:hypothetical protein
MTSRFSGFTNCQSLSTSSSLHHSLIFRKSPFLPKILHKILQILKPKHAFIKLLPIKRLAESPPCINPSESFQAGYSSPLERTPSSQLPAEEFFLAASKADFTPSRKTWLCREVFAEPQKGTQISMKSG